MKLLLFLFITMICLFFSCSSVPNEMGLINEGLPEDIKLTTSMTQVIDSTFRFNKNKKVLASVTHFKLNKGILTSRVFQSFDNGISAGILENTCGKNGNFIQSISKEADGKVRSTTYQKRDEYGYPIELKVIPAQGKSTVISIENTYSNNQLVAVENKNQEGNTFDSQTLSYNNSGKLIEKSTNSFAQFLTQNEYDENQNLILYKHYRNNVLEDSIVYRYEGEKLKKEQWYQLLDGEFGYPMVTEYQYNQNNFVIKEVGTFGTVEYTLHDELGNWLERKMYSNTTLKSVTKRIIE